MNTAWQIYDWHKCTINYANMHNWHNWIWASSITCLTKDWIFVSLNLWLICLIRPTTKYVLLSYSNSYKHNNLFIQEHAKRNSFWINFITTQTLTPALFNPQPEILCESQPSRRSMWPRRRIEPSWLRISPPPHPISSLKTKIKGKKGRKDRNQTYPSETRLEGWRMSVTRRQRMVLWALSFLLSHPRTPI